jgi:hypothetical protein
MGFSNRAIFIFSRAYANLLVWSAAAVVLGVVHGPIVVSATLATVMAIALYAVTAHLTFAMIVGPRHGMIRNRVIAERLRDPLAVGLVGSLVAMALHQHFPPARTTAIAVCATLGIVAERHRALFFAQLRTRLKDALFGWARSSEVEPTPPPTLPAPELPERQPDAETVVAILEQVRLSVAGEDERARHLDSKAAQLLTFSGVVLALTGTLGGLALSAHLAGAARVLAGVFFIGALVVLLIAAVCALVAFRPAQYLGLDEDALEKFTEAPKIYLPAWRVRGDIATGLFRPLRRAYDRNEWKAKWIKRAATMLVLGLVVVAAEASILGMHQIGVIDGRQTNTKAKSSR